MQQSLLFSVKASWGFSSCFSRIFYIDTTVYLIKGTKYSLEIHQFPNMLNFNENICLKTRQVLKTFEVKIELTFFKKCWGWGFFRMTACLPITLLEVLYFFIAYLFPMPQILADVYALKLILWS